MFHRHALVNAPGLGELLLHRCVISVAGWWMATWSDRPPEGSPLPGVLLLVPASSASALHEAFDRPLQSACPYPGVPWVPLQTEALGNRSLSFAMPGRCPINTELNSCDSGFPRLCVLYMENLECVGDLRWKLVLECLGCYRALP